QSSIVEKGVTRREYRLSRIDVVAGCLLAAVVAWFIVVACAATLYAHGHPGIRDAADAAQAFRPLAGGDAPHFFRAGPFQRKLVCSVDSAALDGLHRLRGFGF